MAHEWLFFGHFEGFLATFALEAMDECHKWLKGQKSGLYHALPYRPRHCKATFVRFARRGMKYYHMMKRGRRTDPPSRMLAPLAGKRDARRLWMKPCHSRHDRPLIRSDSYIAPVGLITRRSAQVFRNQKTTECFALRSFLARIDQNDTASNGFTQKNKTVSVQVKPCMSVR